MINNIIQLPDLKFIAGSYQYLKFDITNNSTSVDLSTAEISFIIGTKSRRSIIKKVATIEDNAAFIELLSTETNELCGDYIGQIEIKIANTKVYIPAEMKINIIGRVV